MSVVAERTDRAGSWAELWRAAATGPDGYWQTHRVADGFRTAATTTASYAEALTGILDEDRAGRPAIRRVIDIGAGDGDLITAIARRRPTLRCLGVDVRPGPDGSERGPGRGRAGWLVDRWTSPSRGWSTGRLQAELADEQPTMIICSEWLDELPVEVLTVRDGSRRAVHVRTDGTEDVPVEDTGPSRSAVRVSEADHAWADRWWPCGERIEIGADRDRAWAWLVDQLGRSGGTAVAVDYGHLRSDRPALGSLRAFRDGRLVPPRPDGRSNLSCAVAFDSVRAAGEAAGATTVALLDGHRAVARYAVAVEPASTDPLAGLARRSRRQTLTSRRLFGSYRWLIQDVRRRGAAD